MRVRRVVSALLIGAAALSGVVACTGDEKDSQPTTLPTVTGSASTPSSASNTSSAPTDQQQIVSQWEGYWTTLLSVQSADENTMKIELGKFAQPGQVNMTVDILNDRKAKGYTQTGGISFGKTQANVSGDSGTLLECRNLSDLVVKDSSGSIIQQSPPDVLYTGNFTKVQGQVWALDSIVIAQNQSCQ